MSETMADASQRQLVKSLRVLARRDVRLNSAIEQFGLPQSRKQPTGFATLARIIVGQQLSTKAADSIWRRLVQTTGRVSATSVLAASNKDLRAAGLSRSKVKTLQALSATINEGALNLGTLWRKENAEIKDLLTQVWGIGDWTADIYIMFAMDRPDVWPMGDLALRTGWQVITQSEDRISAEDLATLAENWRPHRSAAAVLLWHAVGATREKN